MATRNALLKTLRAQGYTGKADLESVKNFINENELEIPDLETMWATKKVITIEDDAPAPAPAKKELSATAREVASITASSVEADTKGSPMTPAALRRIGERKAYARAAAQGKTAFSDAEIAEGFSAAARLAAMWNYDYAQKAADMDICRAQKTMLTTSTTGGQALVFDQFAPEVIRLVDQYDAYRQAHPPVPMTSDVWVQPKETGRPTVYYPGEGNAVTETNPTVQTVSAYAKEAYVLTQASLSIMESSPIAVADYIGRTIATAIGLDREDKALQGDGTSADHNYTGWLTAIGAVASNTSVVDGSGTDWTGITEANLLDVVARCPDYARPNARWIMSGAFYYSVCMREALLLGGSSAEAMLSTPNSRTLLGYPVVFASSMPTASTTTGISALFGDFSKGAIHGEVTNGFSIAQSDQRYFDQGLVAFRARYRWAFNIHAPGTNGTAGPVIALDA